MIKIFRNLGKHWKVCLLVFALLLVQANCDLSLPNITSDIVDVGIQMGGVQSTVPGTVRQQTLEALLWLMPQEDAELAENSYGPADADGIRTLMASAAALEDIFTTPDIMLYMMSSQNTAGADSKAGPAELDAAVQMLCSLPQMLTGMAAQMQAAAAGQLSPEQMAAMQSGSFLPEGFALSPEDTAAMMQALAGYTGEPEQTRAFLQSILGKISGSMDESALDLLGSQAKLLVGQR